MRSVLIHVYMYMVIWSLQVTKGDVYTSTVYSPIVGQAHGGCPVYANVPMTCARMRNLPPSVNEDDLFRFFTGLQVSEDVDSLTRT